MDYRTSEHTSRSAYPENDTIQLVFQPEQCFSLTRIQPEQCFQPVSATIQQAEQDSKTEKLNVGHQ